MKIHVEISKPLKSLPSGTYEMSGVRAKGFIKLIEEMRWVKNISQPCKPITLPCEINNKTYGTIKIKEIQ